MKMEICYIVLIIFSLVSVSLSQPPLYSEPYAKVRYQAQWKEFNLIKGELNADQTHKEEVTENSRIVPDAESILIAESGEPTTERESEQINFAIIQRGQLIKDKLQQHGGGESIKAPDFLKADSAVTNLENLDDRESEVGDLNYQGVYYIIHPNRLFQKVAYKATDQPQYMQLSTQIQYENIDPITEPIYTYDPATFVFQRLLFGSLQ